MAYFYLSFGVYSRIIYQHSKIQPLLALVLCTLKCPAGGMVKQLSCFNCLNKIACHTLFLAEKKQSQLCNTLATTVSSLVASLISYDKYLLFQQKFGLNYLIFCKTIFGDIQKLKIIFFRWCRLCNILLPQLNCTHSNTKHLSTLAIADYLYIWLYDTRVLIYIITVRFSSIDIKI